MHEGRLVVPFHPPLTRALRLSHRACTLLRGACGECKSRVEENTESASCYAILPQNCNRDTLDDAIILQVMQYIDEIDEMVHIRT